jgi:hypothetical protein
MKCKMIFYQTTEDSTACSQKDSIGIKSTLRIIRTKNFINIYCKTSLKSTAKLEGDKNLSSHAALPARVSCLCSRAAALGPRACATPNLTARVAPTRSRDPTGLLAMCPAMHTAWLTLCPLPHVAPCA